MSGAGRRFRRAVYALPWRDARSSRPGAIATIGRTASRLMRNLSASTLVTRDTITKPYGDMGASSETATLGGGCFWCVEAVFEQVDGVQRVVSGYSGGRRPNPSYEQVCSGATGHAEVVQVTFDSGVISYREILEIFFATHDPTTLNRQGADIGTQYRSVIFFHSPDQKAEAERVITELTTENAYERPIVTEVVQLEAFYPAEDYHQGYYRKNPGQGYCQAVIAPKLAKFRQTYAERLRQ